MTVVRMFVKQDSIYEWIIRRAEDWHDYYEIPVELAGPYLSAQRDADLFKLKILKHIEDHHLRDQPAEETP